MSRKARRNSSREDTKPAKPEKFLLAAREEIKVNQIKPLNDKQAEYMRLIENNDLVVATGFAGTSKTFIACCMAADAYKRGDINRIVLARPAESGSKGLGFAKGTTDEKMLQWIRPMLEVLYMRLGKVVVDLAVMDGNITLQPLESIKGMSFGKYTWVIADECEDCTDAEIKSIVTRIGTGCKINICGDTTQKSLKGQEGLSTLVHLIKTNARLAKYAAHVDFDDPEEHIVRGELTKAAIIAYASIGK